MIKEYLLPMIMVLNKGSRNHIEIAKGQTLGVFLLP